LSDKYLGGQSILDDNIIDNPLQDEENIEEKAKCVEHAPAFDTTPVQPGSKVLSR